MKKYEQMNFPIINSNNLETKFKSIDRLNKNRIFNQYLNKNKYDIDYVINLLRIIHDKVESMKMNPKDIPFTLCDSLKRLISNLEVERDQIKYQS